MLFVQSISKLESVDRRQSNLLNSMNKEKLIQLRTKVNELFFKKSYQREKSAERSIYQGVLL